jgi:hypothetical protein
MGAPGVRVVGSGNTDGTRKATWPVGDHVLELWAGQYDASPDVYDTIRLQYCSPYRIDADDLSW